MVFTTFCGESITSSKLTTVSSRQWTLLFGIKKIQMRWDVSGHMRQIWEFLGFLKWIKEYFKSTNIGWDLWRNLPLKIVCLSLLLNGLMQTARSNSGLMPSLRRAAGSLSKSERTMKELSTHFVENHSTSIIALFIMKTKTYRLFQSYSGFVLIRCFVSISFSIV